jgi:hypothetical protein
VLLVNSGAKAQRVEDLLPGKTKLEAVEYKGQKAIRMMVAGEGEGLAMLRDTEFGDGTIEADVAVKVTTPPGIHFSNVRITHAKRQPVENGSEVAGTWELKYGSDAGPLACVMKLRREGTTVSGTASGLMGTDLPVAGIWRSGYVEITFHGTWPARDAGATTARLAGWIDGSAAKGRMTINGRADGVWTATRKD